jgi:hypothetical protein
MNIQVSRDSKALGQFTLDELKAKVAQGEILRTDVAVIAGRSDWMGVGQLIDPPPAPDAPASPEVKRNLAVTALILAILALLCGIILAIPAIIAGHRALGEMRKGDDQEMRVLAIVALAIGYFSIPVQILAICAYELQRERSSPANPAPPPAQVQESGH